MSDTENMPPLEATTTTDTTASDPAIVSSREEAEDKCCICGVNHKWDQQQQQARKSSSSSSNDDDDDDVPNAVFSSILSAMRTAMSTKNNGAASVAASVVTNPEVRRAFNAAKTRAIAISGTTATSIAADRRDYDQIAATVRLATTSGGGHGKRGIEGSITTTASAAAYIEKQMPIDFPGVVVVTVPVAGPVPDLEAPAEVNLESTYAIGIYW